MSTPLDNTDYLKKEFANASDRAAAIVGGAFVDELMSELLKNFLVSDDASDKKLFSGSGLLATFSAKIDLSYRLGLISHSEHKALHSIRSIRNVFAHEMGNVSFNSQSVRDKCMNISVPESMLVPDFVPSSKSGETAQRQRALKAAIDDPRGIFQEAISHFMRVLTARTIQAKGATRTSPEDFRYAHETLSVTLARMKEIERDLLEVIEEANAAGGASQAEIAKQSLGVFQTHLLNTEIFIQQIKASHQS